MSQQERPFWDGLNEAWEKELDRPVPVTPQTMAGLVIVLYFYSVMMVQLFEIGWSNAAENKPEPPMLTLQSGRYMKRLLDRRGIADSEVLDTEVSAVVTLRQFQR